MKIGELLIQEINKWKPNDNIVIQAGTGKGKSYFIKNMLYAIAKFEKKKILYLVNRTRLLNQFDNEISSENKNDVITLKTYQNLETSLLHGSSVEYLYEYDYIVCDEFHYFFTDASFNKTTDLSLKEIVNSKDHVKIFMSATGDFATTYFTEYLNLNVKQYKLPDDFKHIRDIVFYHKEDVLKKFLFTMNKQDKAIMFCHSAKKALEFSKEFQNSLFVCSEDNKIYSKYLDKEKTQQMLVNERFEEQYLFTTHTLDNGINIVDRQVKYIIVDVEDFDVMIQCLGRKRIQDKEDVITILIKTLTPQMIGGRVTQLNKRIQMAEFLMFGGSSEDYIKQFPRQYNDMIYEDIVNGKVEKVVNQIMYYKCLYDISVLTEILKRLKENNNEDSYIQYILQLLKRGKKDYLLLEKYFDELTLIDYLDSWIGKKMFENEREQFKAYIKQNLITTPKANHGSIGINTLNGFFADIDVPYLIESREEKERKSINRGKRYWTIRKIS